MDDVCKRNAVPIRVYPIVLRVGPCYYLAEVKLILMRQKPAIGTTTCFGEFPRFLPVWGIKNCFRVGGTPSGLVQAMPMSKILRFLVKSSFISYPTIRSQCINLV
ncbi:hypothetical protein AA313_de0203032 [Arthrobotrys entomopaga]|nr:hypothetical protein AA313_de0203032 [Arthrobotrys entomopaga]